MFPFIPLGRRSLFDIFHKLGTRLWVASSRASWQDRSRSTVTVKWLCLREQLNTLSLAMSSSLRLVSMILGFIHIVPHTGSRPEMAAIDGLGSKKVISPGPCGGFRHDLRVANPDLCVDPTRPQSSCHILSQMPRHAYRLPRPVRESCGLAVAYHDGG